MEAEGGMIGADSNYAEDFSILNYALVPEFNLVGHPLTIEEVPLQPSTIEMYAENEASFSE